MTVGLGLMAAFAAGLACGVLLLRYGMGLGERMAWAEREGVPALSESDAPLEQDHTSSEADLETES